MLTHRKLDGNAHESHVYNRMVYRFMHDTLFILTSRDTTGRNKIECFMKVFKPADMF